MRGACRAREDGFRVALATDAATGQSIDLRPLAATPAELRLALRASAELRLPALPQPP